MGIGNILMHLAPGSWVRESGILDTTVGKIVAATFVAHWMIVFPLSLGRVKIEDEVLSKEFGDEWQAWAQRTPYKMIPYVF